MTYAYDTYLFVPGFEDSFVIRVFRPYLRMLTLDFPVYIILSIMRINNRFKNNKKHTTHSEVATLPVISVF